MLIYWYLYGYRQRLERARRGDKQPNPASALRYGFGAADCGRGFGAIAISTAAAAGPGLWVLVLPVLYNNDHIATIDILVPVARYDHALRVLAGLPLARCWIADELSLCRGFEAYNDKSVIMRRSSDDHKQVSAMCPRRCGDADAVRADTAIE